MTSPGGDLGGLGWFIGYWAAMSAAMMLPASAPVLVRVARAWHTRALGFLAGYGVVWMVVGLAGYGLVEGVRALDLRFLGWSSAGRYMAAAAVGAAGLYQLTHAKRRWLERCTSAYALERRGPGSLRAAFGAGLEHGRCCVACCFTLMVALYALGMMSLTWMALITVLIVGERWVPRRALVAAVAVALVMLGLGVAAAPSSVPGLTVPGPRMTAMAGSMR